MKHFVNPFLSLAAPCLILLSIVGLLQGKGISQVQSLPALFVGSGLIVSGALGRSRRRKNLLFALRNTRQKDT